MAIFQRYKYNATYSKFFRMMLLCVLFQCIDGKSSMAITEQTPNTLEYAVLGAGCFWCVESEYQAIEGVHEVVSGYAGGHVPNPSYKDVSAKKTGHFEVVRIAYDSKKVSYEKLIEAFWLIHDPTQENGQGVDIGPQYRSVIMPLNAEQERIAQQSKQKANASGGFRKPIVTIIQPIKPEEFYLAEDYHQNYYQKQGIVYDSVFKLGGESTTMKKRKSWFGF